MNKHIKVHATGFMKWKDAFCLFLGGGGSSIFHFLANNHSHP